MTWTKLSDDFSDDCETLSDQAFRLHVEGLNRSNRKLLDCMIPKTGMQRWATHPEAVQELLDTGYWTDAGDRYLIRHHAGYQRTREQVIAQQERNQRNGASGGRPKKATREVWTPETQVGSTVGSQTETHRDRPGQDGPGPEELPRQREEPDQRTDRAPAPPPCGVDLATGELDDRCAGCGEPLGWCRC